MSVFTSFSGGQIDLIGSVTPVVSVVSMPLAATEYSFVLPQDCRQFLVKTRSGAVLQVAYASGQSGTTYMTVPRHCFYAESDIKLTSTVTLYFQSPLASQELEVLTWV